MEEAPASCKLRVPPRLCRAVLSSVCSVATQKAFKQSTPGVFHTTTVLIQSSLAYSIISCVSTRALRSAKPPPGVANLLCTVVDAGTAAVLFISKLVNIEGSYLLQPSCWRWSITHNPPVTPPPLEQWWDVTKVLHLSTILTYLYYEYFHVMLLSTVTFQTYCGAAMISRLID